MLALLASGCKSPGEYQLLGGGHGGPMNSANVTVEGGRVTQLTPPEGRNSLLAWGMTLIFNGDGIPSGKNAGVEPWKTFYKIDSKYGNLYDIKKGRGDLPELGLFGKYGLEVIEDTGLFATVLGGASVTNEKWYCRSTMWPYEYHGTYDTTIYGMFGGGISYFLRDDLFLQVDFDNRRGVTGGLGWRY